MSGRSLTLTLLLLTGLVQLTIPAMGIAKYEQTLAEGRLVRFRCAPVDPADPFRGRYVALEFDGAEIDAPPGLDIRPGSWVYATLEDDPDGFARVSQVAKERPIEGTWLRVQVRHRWSDRLRLRFPFDRYYLKESLAPRAEGVYRQGLADGDEPTWAAVRVQDGLGVLEELYVGDRVLLDVTREARTDPSGSR